MYRNVVKLEREIRGFAKLSNNRYKVVLSLLCPPHAKNSEETFHIDLEP